MKKRAILLTFMILLLLSVFSVSSYASNSNEVNAATDYPICEDWWVFNEYEDCINGKWTLVTQWAQSCLLQTGEFTFSQKKTYKTLLNVCPM